nr:MAG TPA: virion morphogenesis protein [Caudoviricetes sp.]
MLFTIVKAVDKVGKLIKGINYTKDNYLLIGIPQKKTTREDEAITNAELLFIHTNGSPINNVPARPVIEPALEDDMERLTSMLKDFANEAIEGNFEEAQKQLEKTGMRAQNVCRNWFTNADNNWPENAPSVRERKIKKGSTEPRPLIDTGELRKSIIYVVVKDGERTD